jgi:hypothetical protein
MAVRDVNGYRMVGRVFHFLFNTASVQSGYETQISWDPQWAKYVFLCYPLPASHLPAPWAHYFQLKFDFVWELWVLPFKSDTALGPTTHYDMNIGGSTHGREDIHLPRSNLKATNVLRFNFLYSEAQTSSCLTTFNRFYSDEAKGWIREEVGFYSRQQEIILLSTASRSDFGHSPPSNPTL